jgi:2-oxoglutarate dehydrogenase E2 component (dihydrolipoamide succinyltransferase)
MRKEAMSIDVTVPPVGESITEGLLAEWLKRDGERVEVDEPLFSLETDKVSITINATAAGLLHIRVPASSTVRIGEVVATIDERATAAEAPPISPPAGMAQVQTKLADPAVHLTPAARRAMRELAVDPATIAGRAGRVTREDLLDASARGSDEPSPVPARSTPAQPPPSEPERAVTEPAALSAEPTSRTGLTPVARQTRTRLSPLRQRIAERMLQAAHESATVTTFNELDMTSVLALRTRHREEFQRRHGVDLGLMSFFVKAVVDALGAVPELNAQIQGDELVRNHYYDIGIAVSTGTGLVVPVLHDADALSLADIERSVAELVSRVRAGTITLAELSGGVFSITNGGVFGSLLSTPLLNPPQAGILGMHAIQKRPVAIDDQIVIRPMMYLALTYDHRLVDGREAVTFLKRVITYLESPGFNLLGL